MFNRSLTSFLVAIFTVACTLATFGQASSHGFREIDKNQTQRNQYQYGLVATGKDWSRYSLGANAIQDCSVRGDETWLATEAGIKRIDYAKKRIDHFSMQDGLPGEKVSAISADSEGVWAIVNTKNGDQLTSLVCRLERNAKTWKSVKSMARVAVPKPRISHHTYRPGEPTEVGIISISPEKAAFTTSPIAPTSSCALIYDRRLKTWQPLSIPQNLYKSEPSTLTIAFTYIDRDNLWLGTNAGLFQYRHREKTWKSHLNTEIIHAGTRATDGTIWVAAYPTVVPENNERPIGRTIQNKRLCTLVKINPNTAATKEYPVISQNQYEPTINISGLYESNGTLWLIPTKPSPYSSRLNIRRFTILEEKFDLVTLSETQLLNLLPAQALQLPSLPRGKVYAAQFRAHWFCNDLPKLNQPIQQTYAKFSPEEDGSYWNWDGSQFTRTSKDTAKVIEKFGKWDPNLPISSNIKALIAHQNSLYALSPTEGLFRFSLDNKQWTRTSVPISQYWNLKSDILFSDNKSLLVSENSRILEYLPNQDAVRQICKTPNQNIILGKDSRGVIFNDDSNRHYRADGQTFDQNPRRLDMPLQELRDEFVEVFPLQAENEIIWFHLRRSKLQNSRTSIIGLDQKNNTWTPALIGERQYLMQKGLSHGTKTTFYFANKLVTYNRDNRTWTERSTEGLSERMTDSLQLVSADDVEIWCYAGFEPMLLRYTIETKTWEKIPLPLGSAPYKTNNLKLSARIGDSIYLITQLGLIEYQISRKQWNALPKLHASRVRLNEIQRRGDVLWATTSQEDSDAYQLVAYNRKTDSWQTWTEKENFPVLHEPQGLYFIGQTPYILKFNTLYYLDLAKNQWHDVNSRLFPNGFKFHVNSIRVDGKAIWILPSYFSGVEEPSHTAIKNAMLLRFDTETGKLESFKPSEKGIRGTSLTWVNGVFWIGSSEGIFRFDPKTREWYKPMPPQEALGVNPFVATNVYETATQYVLGNHKEIIYWKK